MKLLHFLFIGFYDRFVLKRPGIVILLLLMVIGTLGYQARHFRLDASAESLLLENDKDLQYARKIFARYDLQDFLLISFTPKENLFSDASLTTLSRLKDDLMALPRVTSVVSILDAPLLESSGATLKEMAQNIMTLQSAEVDRRLAKQELSKSPLYQNLLVSPDARHTAIQINFQKDIEYLDLLDQRNKINKELINEKATPALQAEQKEITRKIHDQQERIRKAEHENIAAVRKIMKKYQSAGKLFLGGVDMIADDLLTFIRNDLKIFGTGVFLLLVLTLALIFRQIRWIILPLTCCAGAVISMMGILGMFQWEVTVVSSNFISLQLIITLAMVIHLIVSYREQLQQNPEAGQQELVLATLRTKAKPCLYAALTTIAGFGSLLLCDILPVITFGWMMSAGILVSLLITFLFFPVGMMLMKKKSLSKKNEGFDHFATQWLAKFTHRHGNAILAVTAITFILSFAGIARLEVENSFIDYFKKNTEIYQGMKIIDRNLGGTTPMDIVVQLEPPHTPVQVAQQENTLTDAHNDNSDFEIFDETDEAGDEEKYWFTSDRMTKVLSIHDYLENLPEIGKVLSLGTLLQIAQQFNNGNPLDNFQLALVYSEISDEMKARILTPYVYIPNNEVRFSLRVMDSSKTLKRDALIKQIRSDLIHQLKIPADQFRITGMMVLYNNMLQSLFHSQILTLGMVVAALFTMFMILFRSWKVSLIALFPNLFASGAVLGIMGWFAIPLDIMTITIAAISIGIAVDDTIHYIHRFKHELEIDHNYTQAMYRSHAGIGHALYYTSLTVIIGFSVLTLSNFLPTIYFGLFTSLAMLIALIACLTLLPYLLIRFKPFG
ncbi:efflux RND transporter permease subunit [Desulfobacula phenolica]|uniref:SSD domain-containing protein n=1 Tax=Desulfobacula phenolica TaxID=90732 RepID=A0A1H2EH23_9BACT|nr:MMPL family transporter [Desulfobacula phenolica]SDT94445.1 hypothetical protein SAMN04487931_103113 [Desulfobacula phenolica]